MCCVAEPRQAERRSSNVSGLSAVRLGSWGGPRRLEPEARGTGQRVLPDSRFHVLYPSDIKRLLALAAFTDVSIKGGFDGREFTRDGEELVVEAVEAPRL